MSQNGQAHSALDHFGTLCIEGLKTFVKKKSTCNNESFLCRPRPKNDRWYFPVNIMDFFQNRGPVKEK